MVDWRFPVTKRRMSALRGAESAQGLCGLYAVECIQLDGDELFDCTMA